MTFSETSKYELSPLERAQVYIADKHGERHPVHSAALQLLTRLAAQGYECRNIPEAIEQGLLTDEEWCNALRDLPKRRQRRGGQK